MKTHFLIRLIGAGLAGLLALWPVSPALAAPAPNFTAHWFQATDTFLVTGSCSDPDGVYQITIVATGVAHATYVGDGVRFSLSETGDFWLAPVEAVAPTTYAGHYATHLQFNEKEASVVWRDIFVETGEGSDGTREVFRIIFRFTLTAAGLEREVTHVILQCN